MNIFLGVDLTSDRASKVGRVLDIFGKLLDEFLVPFLIAIAILGSLYGIWLDINYSRQEGEAKSDAKKRIINFLIGFVCIIILLLLLRLYVNNADGIVDWVEDTILKNA